MLWNECCSVEQSNLAVMHGNARNANTLRSPIIPVKTDHARSVDGWELKNGQRKLLQNCDQWIIFISFSLFQQSWITYGSKIQNSWFIYSSRLSDRLWNPFQRSIFKVNLVAWWHYIPGPEPWLCIRTYIACLPPVVKIKKAFGTTAATICSQLRMWRGISAAVFFIWFANMQNK